MHTSQWNRERFKDVLEEIQKRTNLSQAELAQLAGRNRTQINRWLRAENQPSYGALQNLASATSARYPEIASLARDLMEAAGYSTLPEADEIEEAVEAKATAPESPDATHDVAAMEAEIARYVAEMSPEERRQYERAIREEEEDYDRRRLRRRLIYAKLMRGEPIGEPDVRP